MKLALTIPGLKGTPIDSGLPAGTPTGGLFTKGSEIIGVALALIIVIGICFSVYNIAQAVIEIITSGGEKETFHKGRMRLQYSIVGLVFLLLSFFFVNILGLFFGVNLLSFWK